MPSMIQIGRDRNMVSVKKKLFVFGGVSSDTNCEVFDKTSNRFVNLNNLILSFHMA